MVNIRETLKEYDCYCPFGKCAGQQSIFQPVTEVDVRKNIASLPNQILHAMPRRMYWYNNDDHESRVKGCNVCSHMENGCCTTSP